MRPVAIVAFLLLIAVGRASAGNCDACMPEKLCVRHQKEQDDTMKEMTRVLKNKDAMKRKEALDKLGKLNNEHMNSRSKELAAVIADMLDDTDAGVRMGAVGYMGSNQEVKTARKEIGKLMDRLIPKVSKPKPSGKSATSGNLALEWENSLSLVKECLPAMEQLGGEEVADYFIMALRSDNLALAAFAIPKSVGIKSEKLVEAYMDRLEKLASGKEEDEKAVCEELAKAFSAQTSFAEQLGENRSVWLKKAQAWWHEKKETYNPPPEPPKEGEDGK